MHRGLLAVVRIRADTLSAEIARYRADGYGFMRIEWEVDRLRAAVDKLAAGGAPRNPTTGERG